MALSISSTNKRIAFVIGSAGFIGRHVCRTLSHSDWIVYGLGHGDWKESEYRQWGISKWLNADISIANLQSLAQENVPQVIIHCAGSGAVSASYSAPYQDFERTVSSTAMLLEFARNFCSKETRIVIASSAAVYGDQGDIDFYESSPRLPISPYGFHKVASENLCESYSRFFDVKTSIVRLFSVYGEGLRKQLLWDAVNKFAKGQAQFFGSGNELRDWIHVDDAATLLCKAATMPQEKFELYNGGHVKATTKEVLSLLAQFSHADLEPHFNNEIHIGNPSRLTSNCSQAHGKLNWIPAVDLRQGLARYADWYIAQGQV